MKANVKKFMAVIAATAMCAVPMTANASGRSIKDASLTLNSERITSIESIKQTSPISKVDPDRSNITIVNGSSTKVILTGRNVATCVDPDGTVYSNCTEITFAETEITGTYRNSHGRDFLNAYNQIAGHPIKTTTVGISLNK